MRIVRLDRMKQVLRKVDFAAFEHRQALAPAGLDDLHLDIRKMLRVTVEKLHEHAFDMLRRSGDFQRARVAPPQQLCALADGGGVVQETATVAEKLFALGGQDKAARNPVE